MEDDQILGLISQESKREEGFRILMQTYQERIYWQIRQMVVNHEDANDVMQNTFIKVFKNIDRFERKAKLYTWLFRIATNESITFLRKVKSSKLVSLESEKGQHVQRNLHAEPFMESEKLLTHLNQAVSELPKKQQEVFRLRYFEELSYQSISKLLGTSEGALKASFHHAVKKVESQIRLTSTI